MPFAIVQGQPYMQVPKDLYIPPDALEVFLEAFEGPLDLLLYLIRRQNLDILDIPIAEITKQYMGYIEMLDLPRTGRDFVVAEAFMTQQHVVQIPPEVDLADMLDALRDVLGRAELFSHHQIQMEPLSVRERMTSIIDQLRKNPYMEFQFFFTPEEGRMGVVVTFLALMELIRERIVDIIQNEPMGQIYVKSPE